MVRKLSVSDIKAIKRLEQQRRTKPFVTYAKSGRITRYKSLIKAKIIAKGQSLLGRRGFVDRDDGKFIRSIKIFEPRRKIMRRKRLK